MPPIRVVLVCLVLCFFFFFSSRRRHTRWPRDWSSDVCSSDLTTPSPRVLTASIWGRCGSRASSCTTGAPSRADTTRPSHAADRSEEHTSELQSRGHLVCRLLLENKKRPRVTASRRNRESDKGK